MRRKIILIIAVFAAAVIVCAAGVVRHYGFTEEGASALARWGIETALGPCGIRAEKWSGTVAKGILIEKLEIRQAASLPDNAILKAGKVKITLSPLSPYFFDIDLHNGKITVSNATSIIAQGSLNDGFINLGIYAKDADVRDIIRLLRAEGLYARFLSGIVGEADLKIRGKADECDITGKLDIESLRHTMGRLSACRLYPDLHIVSRAGGFKIYGRIVIDNGTLSIAKSRTDIILSKSVILFRGEPAKAEVNINGSAKVDNIKITVSLGGSVDDPDISLRSMPPMPEDRLLLMLATGKSWQEAEKEFAEGRVPANFVKDFVSFLMFSGSDDFSMDNISLKYDDRMQGVGFKQMISEELGEVSVEAGKEKIDGGAAAGPGNADDKVTLKYKKEF
ncbi:MAG: translocation/assembly module TamB domain-containing protein [Candidatus Omnitrophota bacterium]